jgi:hypothetical protein
MQEHLVVVVGNEKAMKIEIAKEQLSALKLLLSIHKKTMHYTCID